MIVFEYRAVNNNGKVITGTKESDNQQTLFAELRSENLKPISATIKSKSNGNITNSKSKDNIGEKKEPIDFRKIAEFEIIPTKIKAKDYSIFCRQAYTMLNAGMNIISSLQILAVQVENKKLRETIGKVSIELQKGYPLSTCLRMYPKVFPTLFINMIESGELTGNLDGVLLSLAKYYEREAEIGSKIKSATTYPKAIAFVALIVVTLLLTFVVPQFQEVFDSAGTKLPTITLILIAMSDFVKLNWIFLFIALIILIYLTSLIKKYETSKYYYDYIIHKIKVIGPATVKISTARFSRTSATLLESGIPIIQVIKAAAQVSENSLIIKGIEDVSDDIRSGHSLSTMLQSIGYFPPMMISMVNIGEESGDLVGLLDKTADFYEEEMKEAINTLTGLLEPITILFLAVIVGFVVIAILLPVLDMAMTVQ